MQINITARGIELEDSFKAYVNEKLQKLNRYTDKVEEVRVVFSSEKLLDVAEHPEKYPYPVIVRIHGQYGDARKLSPDILKKDIIPRLDPGSVSF